MHRLIGLAGLLLLAAACQRSFVDPNAGPAKLELGARCSSAGRCQSGICADGVCCEAACGASQRCDLKPGSCTDRPPGDLCDAGAQCPNGWCFDGVCCDADCSTTCMTCNLAGGQAGHCTFAADNTDPRHECPGSCSSCAAGVCGPTAPGTDPRGECGSGLVCGLDQQCHAIGGGSCQSDADCSTSRCLFGTCLSVAVEQLTTGLDSSATSQAILGVATTAEGDVAVVIRDTEADANGAFILDKVRVLFRRAGQPWRSADVYDGLNNQTFTDPELPAAVPVFLGRSLFVVSYRPVPQQGTGNCSSAPNDCGLALLPVGADGFVGSPVFLDAASHQLDVVNALATPEGELDLDYADARGFHHAVRAADGTHAWSHQDLARPGDYFATSLSPVRLHGRSLWAFESVDAVNVIDFSGASVATLDGASFPCPNGGDPLNPVYLYPARGYVIDGPIRFTVDCADRSYAVTLDPGVAAPNVVNLHDTDMNNIFRSSVGMVIDGASPMAAFVRHDSADVNSDTVSLLPLAGGARQGLYAVGNAYELVETLDVAKAGGYVQVAFTTAPDTTNGATRPARSYLITVSK